MKTITEINAAIALITKSGMKFDNLVQETAVAVVAHFAEHKDTGVVNRLYRAMPKGSRSTALASWMLKFMAIAVNTGDTKADQPFVFAKGRETDVAGAATEMWYNHKPEKPLEEVFDIQKAVRGLLAKAGKATTLAHGDHSTLVALAKLAGVPESDVTSKHLKQPAMTSEGEEGTDGTSEE